MGVIMGSKKDAIRLTYSVKLLNLSALGLLAIIFAALLLSPPAPLIVSAQQRETAVALKSNVVHILADFTDGSEEGFGFVVGEQNGQLLIATAKHVVRRQDDSGQWSDADKVKVEFFNERGKWHSADLKAVYPRNGQDLSVLSVTTPSGFRWERKSLGAERDNLQNTRVWFIGRTDTPDPWYIPTTPGSINDNTFDTASTASIDINSVRRGTSGAPLISETGILGMIIRDSDGSIATALSVEFIRQFFAENHLNWSLEINKPVDPRLNQIVTREYEGPIRLRYNANSYLGHSYKLSTTADQWDLNKGSYNEYSGYWICRNVPRKCWQASSGSLTTWNADNRATGNPEDQELFVFEMVNPIQSTVRVKNIYGGYVVLSGDVFKVSGNQANASVFIIEF
jgi:Trypsin-like peptidase domain